MKEKISTIFLLFFFSFLSCAYLQGENIKERSLKNKMQEKALERVTFTQEIKEVQKIFKEYHIQQEAFSLCESLNFKSQFKDCLRSIANKTYKREEISECENAFSKESCLKRKGQDHLPKRVRQELQIVLKYLEEKNHLLAKEKVSNLLDQKLKAKP